MKVVHLGSGVIPVPPGDIAASTEEIIYLLTHHLSHLGCQVHVIDIKGGPTQIEKRRQSPVKFHELWHLPLPHRYDFPFLQRFFYYLMTTSQMLFFALLSVFPLNRLLGKEKIEVIHIHNANAALGALMVNKLRRKLGRSNAVTVYTLHSAMGLTKLSWRNRLVYFAEIPTLKLVDHVVALTPAVKKWLVTEIKLSPAKITQIYNAVDTEEIRKFLSQKQGACHQSNIVLCTGGICRRKNQSTAVKTMPKVVAVHPEVKLVFTGVIAQRDYLNSMQKFIAENGLSSCVEFKGEISKEKLYNLYSDAALFLFPSTAEVDPISLKEALAFGLPIVASNIEGIANVVNQEEGSAFLLDPYDVDGFGGAVLRLLEDGTLRRAMSLKAKKLGQTLSYENIAAQTLDLYDRLVPGKKRGGAQ